jgi:plastocyanin
MKRLSIRARRNVEMGAVMAAAGLLAVIGLVPAQASANTQPSPSGSPTVGTTPSVTTPTLATIPTTTVPRHTGPTTTVKAPVRVVAGPGNVAISNFAYSPASLNVSQGTTVTWTNTDPAPHGVTSDSGAFDSSPTNCSPAVASGCITPSGGTYHFTFPTAGTFTYHCRVHSFMHGTIVVAQTVATTTTRPPTGGGGTTTTVASGPGATTATTSASSALATTGAQSGSLIRIALIALLAGLVAVAAAGRRRVQD